LGLYVGDLVVTKTDADVEFVSMSEDESKRGVDFFDMEKPSLCDYGVYIL
jgi:hypothetical protein